MAETLPVNIGDGSAKDNGISALVSAATMKEVSGVPGWNSGKDPLQTRTLDELQHQSQMEDDMEMELALAQLELDDRAAKEVTIEEAIAARALKRAERRGGAREKAEGFARTGAFLFSQKSYKAAQAQYLEAIKLWNGNVDYRVALAGVYRGLGWYEEAAHSATMALTFDPTSSEARYVRGVARLEQRLLEAARVDFETVLEHDPTHLRARAASTEVTHFIAISGVNPDDTLPKTSVAPLLDFAYPRPTDDPVDVASLSDSGDCHHVGNGVPCRFYNHQGCIKGVHCTYMHGGDERSVRDNLGKNVCIYAILSSCKFGPAKCVYSHSLDALPKKGWWTSPEKIERVKMVVEVAERNAKKTRRVSRTGKVEGKGANEGEANEEGKGDQSKPINNPTKPTATRGRQLKPRKKKVLDKPATTTLKKDDDKVKGEVKELEPAGPVLPA